MVSVMGEYDIQLHNVFLCLKCSYSQYFNSQDFICNSPLLYNSLDVSLGNLALNQLIIPKLIFFFILTICLLDIVLI